MPPILCRVGLHKPHCTTDKAVVFCDRCGKLLIAHGLVNPRPLREGDECVVVSQPARRVVVTSVGNAYDGYVLARERDEPWNAPREFAPDELAIA